VSQPGPSEEPSATLRWAAIVVGAQAAALVVVAVVLAVLAATHSSTRLWAALSIVAFALLGAAVLALGARGLLGLRPSARSPIVLLELIALPVGYSLGIQAGRYLAGVPVLLSALAVLVLLFTPSARKSLDRVA
jgi:hypothetical protein